MPSPAPGVGYSGLRDAEPLAPPLFWLFLACFKIVLARTYQYIVPKGAEYRALRQEGGTCAACCPLFLPSAPPGACALSGRGRARVNAAQPHADLRAPPKFHPLGFAVNENGL